MGQVENDMLLRDTAKQKEESVCLPPSIQNIFRACLKNSISLSRRDTASGRCEGAFIATDTCAERFAKQIECGESLECLGSEILRSAQDDILR
jgi:hypothetical protein